MPFIDEKTTTGNGQVAMTNKEWAKDVIAKLKEAKAKKEYEKTLELVEQAWQRASAWTELNYCLVRISMYKCHALLALGRNEEWEEASRQLLEDIERGDTAD